VERNDVDLPELLATLRNEAGVQWEKPGLKFTWDVDPELPHVNTDRLKLMVVLKNLISNAVKFTERGTIALKASAVSGGAEILVVDTGPGIAAEVLPFIFEPFRQGDSSMTRSYGGVGLGLYIVHRLLEMLGGHVSVESKVGQGSTFRVWIPREACPPEGMTQPQTLPPRAAGQGRYSH
jgi:signal transduction histidine kinase